MSLLRPNIDVDKIDEISIAALAYIGDAIYELHVRLNFLTPPRSPKEYHQLVVSRVKAQSQANQLNKLIDNQFLSELELDLVRRGRNATTSTPRHINPQTYRLASGFEALIGYLYLKDPDRLVQILAQADNIL
ncbi:ribonuclease III [Thalassoporum mexicanum PCC 7367]|uniref:Mini-ribonuclease 3 n=1 Tax=Thalassoporum mexicanum TaxID=3457544 RepID=UPI00029F8B03|nr:ribonuclease III domain-containing protein [Pseudanabaena sp. PCC 7367]AFY71105.1 ribonuclease III [Pseudanabaena sp. PCC 7367]